MRDSSNVRELQRVRSILLAGGLLLPCDPAKYSAFSLAVGGLFAALMGTHAYQARNEKPSERQAPQNPQAPLP